MRRFRARLLHWAERFRTKPLVEIEVRLLMMTLVGSERTRMRMPVDFFLAFVAEGY